MIAVAIIAAVAIWVVGWVAVGFLASRAFHAWLRTAELHTEEVKRYEMVCTVIAKRIEKLEQAEERRGHAGFADRPPPGAIRRTG